MAITRQDNLPALPSLDSEVMQDTLTQTEYERFRDSLPNWRDRLICMTLRNTGLRVNEVLGLTVRECALDGPTSIIYVKRSKKRTQDVPYEPIYLQPGLGVQLRDYIKGQALTPTDKAFNIKSRGLRYAFANAGMASLGRPVQPKEFRSFFVQTMVDVLGVPMVAASKMVGHADVRTTQKHYFELNAERRQWIGEGIPV
jgi:integrase